MLLNVLISQSDSQLSQLEEFRTSTLITKQFEHFLLLDSVSPFSIVDDPMRELAFKEFFKVLSLDYQLHSKLYREKRSNRFEQKCTIKFQRVWTLFLSPIQFWTQPTTQWRNSFSKKISELFSLDHLDIGCVPCNLRLFWKRKYLNYFESKYTYCYKIVSVIISGNVHLYRTKNIIRR